MDRETFSGPRLTLFQGVLGRIRTSHPPTPPSLTDPPKTGLHTGVWEGVGLGALNFLSASMKLIRWMRNQEARMRTFLPILGAFLLVGCISDEAAPI